MVDVLTACISFLLRLICTILHATTVQERKSIASPGQLLLASDAAGFWQNRDLRCDPTPHVEVQADHTDHSVQPTAPVNNVIACNQLIHYWYYNF